MENSAVGSSSTQVMEVSQACPSLVQEVTNHERAEEVPQMTHPQSIPLTCQVTPLLCETTGNTDEGSGHRVRN